MAFLDNLILTIYLTPYIIKCMIWTWLFFLLPINYNSLLVIKT